MTCPIPGHPRRFCGRSSIFFRDVFEFALKTNWSYDKRIEFYHSFPFEELPTLRSVTAFRRTLVSCPAFDGFNWTFPEVEEIEE